MNIVKQILLGLAVAGGLAAQQVAAVPPPSLTPPEPPHQQRVFMLKYADARNVANVLGVFGYSLKADRELHVVAVSAPAGVITAMEDAVKRLDVPAAALRDVDLTIYLVSASEQPVASDSVPAELQGVTAELKKAFAYKSFRLLDSVLLRTQPGKRADARGIIPPPSAEKAKTPYYFSVALDTVTDDPKGRLIRLNDLHLALSVPGGNDAGFNTEITVREGQQVVVGKSSMGTDQALILVVTARVAE